MAVLFTLLAGCATRPALRYDAVLPRVDMPRVENVRVLLSKKSKVSVSATRDIEIYNMRLRQKIIQTHLSGDTSFTCQNGKIAFGSQGLGADPVRLVPTGNDFLKVNGKHYRGQIELSLDEEKGSLVVVNYVNIEGYLKGVIPNEASYKWPMEALNAQAVASRTFALSRMNEDNKTKYDLDAGTNSQVYGGLDSEKASSDQAVENTRGLVASYQGRFIAAFYHSNCGGRTANVKDVWGNEISYLRGTRCGYCGDNPHSRWSLEIAKNKISDLLRQHNLQVVGDLTSLDTSGQDTSGRVSTVIVKHSGGEETIKAPVFRMILGGDRLRSTKFTVQDHGASLVFSGQGWGHGVGLCQEGAFGMARAGYRFDEILKYYYPGITISRLETP
jgi:stage II sporulation protein D